MDAGLKVQKLARQKDAGRAPVQPEVVGRKTYQHGAHPKVEPARGFERAHAGVHHGVAGLAGAPGVKAGGVKVVFAQAVAHTCKVFKLDGRLVFELLHEVAMPAQAPAKAAQRPGQCAVCGVGDGVFGGLVHRAHRDGAKRQVRAQAAAGVGGGQGAGHGAPVVAPAPVQKTVQFGPGAGLGAGLY